MRCSMLRLTAFWLAFILGVGSTSLQLKLYNRQNVNIEVSQPVESPKFGINSIFDFQEVEPPKPDIIFNSDFPEIEDIVCFPIKREKTTQNKPRKKGR